MYTLLVLLAVSAPRMEPHISIPFKPGDVQAINYLFSGYNDPLPKKEDEIPPYETTVQETRLRKWTEPADQAWVTVQGKIGVIGTGIKWDGTATTKKNNDIVIKSFKMRSLPDSPKKWEFFLVFKPEVKEKLYRYMGKVVTVKGVKCEDARGIKVLYVHEVVE